MTCDKRDQELLLLAHGALSLPRRVVVQAHLRRCNACRKRLARLTQVSSTLSAAFCAGDRTPWSPAWGMARTRGGAFGARFLAILSLLLFLAVTATVCYLAFSSRASSTPAAASAEVLSCPLNVTRIPPPKVPASGASVPLKIHCRLQR